MSDAAAVAAICLQRGLTPVQADAVWDLLSGTVLPDVPSAVISAVDSAIGELGLNMTPMYARCSGCGHEYGRGNLHTCP